jgi:hypothetical protein
MAENRFKKSVDAATSNTLGNAKGNISDNAKPNAMSNIKNNILKSVEGRERKGRGGSHTFYLSAEVAEELGRISKKTKISKSTLVNDILKAVFEEGRE